MFGAIKPESLRLSKRQHLADFFSWGTKDGTWDNTRDDYKKKGHRASIWPQHLGKPKDGKYRCESPRSTVQPFRCHATTGNSGRQCGTSRPSYSPPLTARSHAWGTKLEASTRTKRFSAPKHTLRGTVVTIARRN